MEELISQILEQMQIELPSSALPEPDLVSFYRLLQDRKFYLDGEIGQATMMLQRLIILCNKEDVGIPVEKRKPIILYIMSYGGDLDYMYMLIDTINLSQTPIYTVNIGVAVSAASLIFMSGHKRFMTPFSKVLIHEGSAKLEGDAVKVMDASEDYKKSLKQMKEFIMAKTEIPKQLLFKKRSNDWTLTADECLTYKVCDRIITTLDEVL